MKPKPPVKATAILWRLHQERGRSEALQNEVSSWQILFRQPWKRHRFDSRFPSTFTTGREGLRESRVKPRRTQSLLGGHKTKDSYSQRLSRSVIPSRINLRHSPQEVASDDTRNHELLLDAFRQRLVIVLFLISSLIIGGISYGLDLEVVDGAIASARFWTDRQPE